MVQNQTDKAVTADVVLEASNLSLTGAHGKRVDVPANDRVEVRFPVETDAAGTARYRVSATDGSHADSATGEFPVYTPVTTEAFATYGVVDNGAIAQPLQTPTGVVPQYGGLEIDTSSTAMQALTDAVVYLEDYQYESADAYASRIIALTSLRGVFAAFGGRGVPTAGAGRRAHQRSDIKALEALQNDDGGFSTWTRGGDPQPYISVQATEALVLARLAGFAVSEQRTRPRARVPPRHRVEVPELLGSHRNVTRSARTRSTFATEAGDRDPGEGRGAVPIRSRPPARRARVAVAGRRRPRDRRRDRADDRESRARDAGSRDVHRSGYDDGAYLVLGVGSPHRRHRARRAHHQAARRATSFRRWSPGSSGTRCKGRWDNIQENGFILVALQRYFAKYEAQTPVVRRSGLARRHVRGRALVPGPFDRPATHARAR